MTTRLRLSLLVAAVATTGAAFAQTGGGPDRAVRIIPRESAPASAPGPAKPLPQAPKLRNAVDLKLEILPGSLVSVGSAMSFRVSGSKPGYVLLVDIDATGKLTQIYPNLLSLANGDAKAAEPNRLSAGAAVAIPQTGSKIYEFVASPPPGIGMVVAVFSETPLDMIDLPDVPAQLVGTAEAATFVRDAAGSLRIVSGDGAAGFQDPNLSFDAAFYAIR